MRPADGAARLPEPRAAPRHRTLKGMVDVTASGRVRTLMRAAYTQFLESMQPADTLGGHTGNWPLLERY